MDEKKMRGEGLSEYTRQRSAETCRRVNAVIDELYEQDCAINFEVVARRSGVSRGTLYHHKELSERIRRLRVGETDDMCSDLRERSRRQEEKLRGLREQVRCLEEEKRKLIVQLLDHEMLRRENERLRQTLGASRTKAVKERTY